MKTVDYDFVLVEVYKQAHETRRKWEEYIWQWGILSTILVAMFARWPESVNEFLFPHKFILPLLAGFIFAVFLNVLRARTLMKELEKTIISLHKQMKNDLPIVPSELDQKLPYLCKISSTKVVLCCHGAAAILFILFAVHAWIK